MHAQLVVVGGETNQDTVELNLPVTIGRGAEVTVRLQHPLVSREHCELFESQGVLFVRDLDSLNGTYIGNHKITEQFLPPGELLTIGTVTFRAVYEIEEAVAEDLDDTDVPAGGDPTTTQTQTVVELRAVHEMSDEERESETDLRVDPAAELSGPKKPHVENPVDE